MADVDIPALETDQLIDWYVKLLDHLEKCLRKSVDSLNFLANRSPEFVLNMPMKPGTYIRGITELQEAYRKLHPNTDLKKIVHSDPEIMATLQWWGSFEASKPKLQETIAKCGTEVSRRIAKAKWGDNSSIDPFFDLEHMMAGHVVGDNLYAGIAAARKQARRFQNSGTDPTEPPNALTEKQVDVGGSIKEIPVTVRTAYHQYRETITANPRLAGASMKDVYRDVERATKIAGIDLPSFETWSRYVREGKSKYESKPEEAD